jgi:hypothetical protein
VDAVLVLVAILRDSPALARLSPPTDSGPPRPCEFVLALRFRVLTIHISF